MRAQERFPLQALIDQHPALGGRALADAVQREQARSSEFRRRMIERVHEDMRRQDTPEAQRAALHREQRYLEQHFAAVAKRLRAETDISRLEAAGETGGVWVMSDHVRKHTADCVRMHGRFWPLHILRLYGPQNRHAGCECQVISVAEAARRGIPWTRGRATKSARVRESVRVPWNPSEHPRGPHGEFIAVHGDIHPHVREEVEDLLDAARRGAPREELRRLYDRAHARAGGILSAEHRQSTERTLRRVYAAAVDPLGARRRAGDGVPLGPPDREGRTRGWANGGFRWRISDGMLGPAHREDLRALAASGVFRAGPAGDHGTTTLEVAPDVPPQRALAAARNLEIARPQLRRLRDSDGGYVEDDTPLDLHAAERASDDHDHTRYPGVDYRVLGDVAELQMLDAEQRLRELHVPMSDKPSVMTTAEHGNLPPLDWEIAGTFGCEVKSFALRGAHPGNVGRGGLGQDPGSRAAKIAECRAKGLRPVLVRVGVDLDSDTAHLFWHEYHDPDAAFKDRRLPAHMVQELLDGTLRPGETRTGARLRDERSRWVYLGSFRLRNNPLRPGQQQLRSKQERARLGALRPRPVDVGVGARRLAAPSSVPRPTRDELDAENRAHRLASNADRDRQIADLARNSDLSQSQIASRLGVSKSLVGNVIRARGLRRPSKENPHEQVRRMHAEGDSPDRIAQQLGMLPEFVQRIVKESAQTPQRKLG